MTKREREKDVLAKVFDKKQTVKASPEAKEKSLRAFQDGLEDNRSTHKKRNRFKKRVMGLSSTVAVAGIVTVLAFSTGIFGGHNDMNIQENGSNQGPQSIHAVTDKQTGDTSNVKEKIWNRHPLEFEDWAAFQPMGIFNDDLEIYLPKDWTVDEIEDEDTYSTHITGTDGEQMNLVLFQKDDPEVFNTHLHELTANFAETEQISIPVDELVDELKSNDLVPFNYNNVFPFEIENAEMTAFVDEANGKFMELYTSELFGYQMIFTSELSLKDEESWNLPIHLFVTMRIHQSLIWPGSEGGPHPEFNRPIAKTVLLPIGAVARPDKVEMELYENEELNMTSYLPKGTEIQQNEHELFTEWHFTNPSISKYSFYSFGKLKDGFPLEDAKEIMFEAFGIDPAFSPPEIAGDKFPHYSYSSANAGEVSGSSIDGFFEFFEANGEWYFKHKHADSKDYNGGYLIARLNYFIDSIEWY
ncbi:hypothetical protein CWR48_04925 [Oceanobacillus arenosus]|uniref:Uncharacterized protein n=1 Tax=Oceanobacillus arenosus TaxID=1229153 RepID=A0A3D8PV80_9BACI|nr:hypothetical protein [Oceanobacillus arenosus]RDW20070.1 hypothetical protein CWR48_04925 [Oceanobacillus arenosus]